MSAAARSRTARWAMLLAAFGLLAGCAGGEVGVGYGYDDYGPVPAYDDFYGPGYWGWWGPGYRVGPPRGGRWGGGGQPGAHYRAAPAGRSMPSIPSGARGGGGHGGGRGR
jgi:hypothetical protein